MNPPPPPSRRPRISTGTGDRGSTLLLGGTRVSKGSLQVDAYGTVDECNAFVGYLRSLLSREVPEEQNLTKQLRWIQARLLDLGAWLAIDPERAPTDLLPPFPESFVHQLEEWERDMEEQLPPLRHFLLPGGLDSAVSVAHICRTVCRRAERLCVRLQDENPWLTQIPAIRFLNRLSDYFFLLARILAQIRKVPEEPWLPSRPGSAKP